MKITIILLTCFLIQVNAKTYGQLISLNKQESSIHNILKEIRKQSQFDFLYDLNLFKDAKPISIKVNNATIDQVLAICLPKEEFNYQIKDKYVTITKSNFKPITTNSFKQEPGKLVGTILDEMGKPIAGASIKIIQTGQASQSAADGKYTFNLAPGIYTIEIRFLSFATRQITHLEIIGGKQTQLNIVLKPESKGLKDVVVTATFKKASIEGLYASQKNNTSLSNGISAEQIARTPDNNMGQVLKRITGVTTIDNSYVMVRGLGDRYNQGMIDGIIVPSTKMNRRDFSFDAIPQEVVSNVVVNKTATPELSAEFAGGQVSVNTLDIPDENFMVIGLGNGYNDQTSFSNFYQMGSWDKRNYFGFSNKSAKMPTGIYSWIRSGGSNDSPPLGPFVAIPDGAIAFDRDQQIPYNSFSAIEQSKRFNNESLKLFKYNAAPDYNGKFVLGKVYSLNKEGLKIGFTFAFSLRNSKNTTFFNNVRGSNFSDDWLAQPGVPLDANGNPYKEDPIRGLGKSYSFNSTLGSVLNIGLKGTNFKIALKNIFTSNINNEYSDRYTYDFADIGPSFRYMTQVPLLTQVRQHMIEGYYKFGENYQIDYGVGLTKIRQDMQDRRILNYRLTTSFNGTDYYQTAGITDPGSMISGSIDQSNRMWTSVDESDYNWRFSIAKQLGKESAWVTQLKLGYTATYKDRSLNTLQAIMSASRQTAPDAYFGYFSDLYVPEKMGWGDKKYLYQIPALNNAVFTGNTKNYAFYAMADQRLFQKLRLIYGARIEYFNLSQKDDDYLKKKFSGNIPYWAYRENMFNGQVIKDKDWRILPSINLVYSILPPFNIRAAYGRTAIRPDFRESSYFGMYDPELNTTVVGKKLVSTIVDNYDLRFEWYPSASEIITIGGFYKYMDKPIELIREISISQNFMFINQDYAKNYGLEFEFRKSLGFINNSSSWLQNIYLFGNASITKSKVKQVTYPKAVKVPGTDEEAWSYETNYDAPERSLVGQVPWIVNGGLMYQGNTWGFSANYNRSSYRTNLVGFPPEGSEYEQGRNLLDMQLYAKFLKRKLEFKLNVSNILNEWRFYYQNLKAYERIDVKTGAYRLLPGHTENYQPDKGDRITYRERTGRSFSLTLTYKF